ncbi:MAG: GNAT family N-acetyltransferase [Actinomycetota bacterium]|nr:GNAT family N-acetyltransferase [Actinomycetota bacterium]MDQ2958391.1 GNAT family N-acetyltransferase [Actinomycetota bacterium]
MTDFVVRRTAPDPAAVRRLLEALPDWFGEPSSLEEYVTDAARMTTYLARVADEPIGVLLVRQHFPEAAEVHLIAVDPGWHRLGVGRALIAAVEADLAATGTRLLQVKTIGPSSSDPFYARTRQFYRGLGFLPLEELLDARSPTSPWPCLVLVKPIRRPARQLPEPPATT